MIDLHAHILPGIDDGPATLEAALDVLRAAVDDGTRVIAATPHVREDYPTTPAEMEQALAELHQVVEEEGISIRVVGGAEIALDRLPGLTDEEIRRFTLGGGGCYVLLEAPYVGWPLDLPQRLFDLHLRGFTPVLGHPERNADVQSAPELLRPLVERGALVQITAASLDGRLGKPSAEAAHTLVALELAHLVASDAHDAHVRRVGLSDAASTLENERLARWLLHDVPLAILGGSRLAPRPSSAKRQRRFGSLRRIGGRPENHEDV